MNEVLSSDTVLNGMKKAELITMLKDTGKRLVEATDAKTEEPTPDEERELEIKRLQTKVRDLQDENKSLIDSKQRDKNGFPENLGPNMFNFMFKHCATETAKKKKFKITEKKDKDGNTVKVSEPVPFFSTRGQRAKHIHLDFLHPVTITTKIKFMDNGEEKLEERKVTGMARIRKKTTMFAAVGRNEDGSAYAWGNVHHDEPYNKTDTILPTPSDPDSGFMEDEDGNQTQEEKEIQMRNQKEVKRSYGLWSTENS